MANASTPLGDIVRGLRRTEGWSQEQLAEEAQLSVGTVRNIEQRGHARLETLSRVAAAFGLTTTELFASGTPLPIGDDSQNRQLLAPLRKVLTPPVGLGLEPEPEPVAAPVEMPDLAEIRRKIEDGLALIEADRYDSVARKLPTLLQDSQTAAAWADEEDREEAAIVHAHVLLLAAKHLTQVRQYDMAYQAFVEGIRIAREQGDQPVAATGVTGLCWLLLRQDRFDECANLAATTAEAVEPKKISVATAGQLASWGELCLRVAAASIRNNRPEEAVEARRRAAIASAALGREHADYRTHWSRFGPATTELKAIEDLSLAGDGRGVLSRADEGVLSKGSLKSVGRPASASWNRHRLDVARAHVSLGSTASAMDELDQIRQDAGAWVQHQPMARYVMEDILRTRKRTLTQQMRDMAVHLNVQV
ncbi:helix-turn-helix transcriptional regulator [Streptomyces sp. HSW2009]|uniref:helix-turn-helix domain-containing protein n=1 Tax=Streptomyces sp. HSW2009 TaxID=3142890 RepID=UPI0032EE1D8C